VTGPGDVKHVQVILLDHPVQMHVNEILSRRRAPMSDHQRLHIREFKRPFEQRIVVKINLADRQIVGRPPVGIDLLEQIRGKSIRYHI